MKQLMRLVAAVLMVGSLTAMTFQTDSNAGTVTTKKDGRAVTVITFDPNDVLGVLDGPPMVQQIVRTGAKFRNRIEKRSNFDPQLVRSVDNL